VSGISAAWFEFPQRWAAEFPQHWPEFPQRWAEFPQRRPVKFPQRGRLAALIASRFAMSINEMGGYSTGQNARFSLRAGKSGGRMPPLASV